MIDDGGKPSHVARSFVLFSGLFMLVLCAWRSLGISWHAGWERGRGKEKENIKQYTWERERRCKREKYFFNFLGDLFWKSLVQADGYLCICLPAVTLGNFMCLLQPSSAVLWDITACVITGKYRGPMKSSPEWINLTDKQPQEKDSSYQIGRLAQWKAGVSAENTQISGSQPLWLIVQHIF